MVSSSDDVIIEAAAHLPAAATSSFVKATVEMP